MPRPALLATALAGALFALPRVFAAEPKPEGRPEIFAYGPGGPLTPVRACAERFSRARGVSVQVDGGPEERWFAKAEKDADLVFGGAEHMLSDFARRHPDFIDPASRASLWVRPAAILVRKGNPKRIRSLRDLSKEGVKLLDVNGAGQVGLWEDLAGRKGLVAALQKNIAVSTSNTAEGIAAWRSRPELDAWITFASWHERLRDETDLVHFLPADRLYRGTPIALTRRSKSRELALAFVEYLKTEECHALFRAAGWN